MLTDNAFSGGIDWVQIDIGDDNHDHLITPEVRLNIAMAKQWPWPLPFGTDKFGSAARVVHGRVLVHTLSAGGRGLSLGDG